MTDVQKKMMDKLGLSEDDFSKDKLSDKERIKELETQNQMLIECLMEMSEYVYA